MALEDYYYLLLVKTPVQGVDEYGDAVSDYGETRRVFGYIGKPSSRAAAVAAQRGVDVTGRLYVPTDAGVQPFDVIHDTATGATFQVASALRDVARRGHHLEADLVTVRGGVSFAD